MNAQERAKFRKSKQWNDFKKYMYEKFDGKDPITGKRLYRGWNLHHLDTNPENYNILDENNFIPLNRKTHSTLHFLFLYDKEILDKFEHYLEIMRAF